MRQSDVFDNFVKIAQEKGLVTSSPALAATEKTRKKLEKTRRADSLSIEDIEKLYNVKPNKSDKRNIIEEAHPDTVIVAPSHDKLNALVENENQRQDITLHILNKIPNGNMTHHKYAAAQLEISLIRAANCLDENQELKNLAKVCLAQVKPDINKKAALPVLAYAIPAVLGALYVQQHMAFINEGFEKNHLKLIAEIDDMINSSASWGVGYDYKVSFKQTMQEFKDRLITFYSRYQRIEPLIAQLEKPQTAQELIQLSKQPQTDTLIKAYNIMKAEANNMFPYIDTIQRNFNSESYKAKQVEDKGFFSSLIDKTQVLHGGRGLVADDFDDIVHAISPYKKSIGEMLVMLKNAESLEKSARQQIESASQVEEPETPTAPVTSPANPNPSSKLVDDDYDSQMKELDRELSGSGLF